MNRTVRYLLSAVVVLTLVLGSVAIAPAARSEASIHLKSGVFVPSQLEAPRRRAGDISSCSLRDRSSRRGRTR